MPESRCVTDVVQERMKFLRLMGGQKFAEAAKALAPRLHYLGETSGAEQNESAARRAEEAGVDDDQVFELIAGEWVQAKEAEEEEAGPCEVFPPLSTWLKI